jgi:hypothetical protein
MELEAKPHQSLMLPPAALPDVIKKLVSNASDGTSSPTGTRHSLLFSQLLQNPFRAEGRWIGTAEKGVRR